MNNNNSKRIETGFSPSETPVALRAPSVSDGVPNPEVTDRLKRRRYTESYKRKVVAEVSKHYDH